MESTVRRISADVRGGLFVLVGVALLAIGSASADAQQFLPESAVTSTIPTSNGDLNPYGVAIVPQGFPGTTLAPGDILVSNFNNAGNQQGTGTTIIQFRPGGPVAAPGTAATFFQSSAIGLTTALGILQRGFVVVGNLPTDYATTPPAIGAGSLQFLNANGALVKSYTNKALDGPWDLTIADEFDHHATLFVSNVLSGTVIRLDLTLSSTGVTVASPTVIAMGYTHRRDPAALVLGPTGLAYDPIADVLYVASTADNAIFGIPQAGSRTTAVAKGTLVFTDEHLFGPLHLAFAPGGHLLTSNGDDMINVPPDPTQPSEIIEFTKSGRFVSEENVDPSQGGAFGFAVADLENGSVRFATVDDVTNTLTVLDRTLQQENMQ